MTDDEDLLADYDLSAWEPPPPPPGLADAVVRRARDPVPHAIATPRSLTPWIIGAGSLAMLVAVLAFVLWGIERAPEDGAGVIAATGPRTLDLGRSSAAIDSGAQLTWTRRGATISVAHSRGGMTWRVSDEDSLIIDAAVASIEASGASLRVEVEMNRSDVRAVGVGSAAAVVVSLVTVIVYEGHVKATSDGQTVNIQPGASMQFGSPAPAPPPPTPPEQLNVGGSPEDQARIEALEAEVARLKLELAARDKKDKPTTPTACDAELFVKKGDDYLGNGMDAAALAQFEKALACKPSGEVSKKALLAACRSKNAAKANRHLASVPSSLHANYTQICLRLGVVVGATPTRPACDAERDKRKGDDYLSNGMDTAALAAFEASLRCKYDTSVVKTAYLAACRSKQASKAKLYFAKLPPNVASNYAQLCLRFGVDVLGTTGTLKVTTTPPGAKVQLDGAEIGTTPLTVNAPAGKHKITFTIDDSKYTYPVTIKSGEVTNLRKDLPAP